MGKVVTGGGLGTRGRVLESVRTEISGRRRPKKLVERFRMEFIGKGDYYCRRVMKVAGMVEGFNKLDGEQDTGMKG